MLSFPTLVGIMAQKTGSFQAFGGGGGGGEGELEDATPFPSFLLL